MVPLPLPLMARSWKWYVVPLVRPVLVYEVVSLSLLEIVVQSPQLEAVETRYRYS